MPSRSFIGRFIRFEPEEEDKFYRSLHLMAWAFLLFLLILLPMVKSGYFREQARMRQARALIEEGGYAWCALWGDKTDQFQLTALNSPFHPRWVGVRQPNGAYLMTFTYRKRGADYRHQWQVQLGDKRVLPVDDMPLPLRRGEEEFQCSETAR